MVGLTTDDLDAQTEPLGKKLESENPHVSMALVLDNPKITQLGFNSDKILKILGESRDFEVSGDGSKISRRIRQPGATPARRIGFRRSSRAVYVGNLAYTVTEELVYELFVQAGPISDVLLVTDPSTGSSKGFAFVEFDDDVSADYAIKLIDGILLMNRALRVRKSEIETPSQAADASESTPQLVQRPTLALAEPIGNDTIPKPNRPYAHSHTSHSNSVTLEQSRYSIYSYNPPTHNQSQLYTAQPQLQQQHFETIDSRQYFHRHEPRVDTNMTAHDRSQSSYQTHTHPDKQSEQYFDRLNMSARVDHNAHHAQYQSYPSRPSETHRVDFARSKPHPQDPIIPYAMSTNTNHVQPFQYHSTQTYSSHSLSHSTQTHPRAQATYAYPG